MAKINFFLKEPNSISETSIYLRYFDKNGNQRKVYLGLKINPKDWNKEKQNARRTFTGFLELNTTLEKYKERANHIFLSLQSIDDKVNPDKWKDTFEREILGKTDNEKLQFKTVTEFAEYIVLNVKTRSDGKGLKTKNTFLHQKQTIDKLKEYERVKNIRLTFERVNIDFYDSFIQFLNSKNYNFNTIGKHIKNLKMFLNEATDRGINNNREYKSKKFSITTAKEEKVSIYLSEDELQNIYNFDFSNRPALDRVRDLFIIGCYTGLRFSDFSTLSLNNITNGFINITTQKTGDNVVIPIRKEVEEILNKYKDTLTGLPRSLSNQKMNEALKELGRNTGINEPITITDIKGGLRVVKTVPKYDLITTHTARRSFATNLYLSGFPAISIMKITGHRTESAFMKYIKISKEENAKLLQLHWNKNTKLKIV
jgi:integrase